MSFVPYRPVLLTERLRLRPFELTDAAAMHEYASDPAVARLLDRGPNNERATRAFVEQAAASRPRDAALLQFAVTLRSDARLIGDCSITIESTEHRRAILGGVFAAAYWSQGFATEAAVVLRDFAFEVLGMHRLAAMCHPDNIASAKVLTKAGLILEGRMRDHMLIRGNWHDSLLFGLANNTGG